MEVSYVRFSKSKGALGFLSSAFLQMDFEERISRMKNGARVFVTGGGGFIAPHLISAMPEDWQVTLHERNPRRADRFPQRAGFRRISGSMQEQDLLKEFERGVDVVIHLAGAVQGPSIEQIIDSNLVTTRDVLAAMEKSQVPKLVFMSTASVWSDRSGRRLDETVEPNPSTLYGYAKLAAERLINGAVTQGRIESCVVLRCNNTYGPGCVQGAVSSFIEQIRKSSLVRIFGDGKQLREPLYVTDLVDVILRSIDPSSGLHLFGISGPQALTILEMAQIVARTMGEELRVEWLEDNVDRVRHITMDTGKAKRELGWTPSVQFKEGIARTLR